MEVKKPGENAQGDNTPPASAIHGSGGDKDVDSRADDRSSDARVNASLTRNMSSYEIATARLSLGSLVVAVASLITSVVSCTNSVDTKQMNNAIGTLTGLATQTKRQADALGGEVNAIGAEDNIMTSEFGEMRAQTSELGEEASAAQGQLSAAKSQTSAIAAQTVAIQNSSSAEVSAAQAQRETAVATSSAYQPAIRLQGALITDWPKEEPKSKNFMFHVNYSFINFGTASAVSGVDTVYLLFASHLDRDARTVAVTYLGGNDLVVLPGATYGTVESQAFSASNEEWRDIKSGKKKLFVFGAMGYKDRNDLERHTCFASEFYLTDPGKPPVLSGNDGAADYCKRTN